MDDPTRQCENDTDNGTRLTRGSRSQAGTPLFWADLIGGSRYIFKIVPTFVGALVSS